MNVLVRVLQYLTRKVELWGPVYLVVVIACSLIYATQEKDFEVFVLAGMLTIVTGCLLVQDLLRQAARHA